MFTGQIQNEPISNKADWIAPFFAQVVTDGVIVNILNPDIGFDCVVTISGDGNHYGFGFGDGFCNGPLITASVANGKVIASMGDDGAGFEWSFFADDLRCLRPGTYRFGVKTTTNGEVKDLIDGTLAVIEGN